MGMRSILFWTAVAAIGVSTWAQAGPKEDKAVERGQAHYLLFCANCHGVNADGKGPLVGLLKVTPGDLTTLKRTGKGESVTERVLKAVAGRHAVESGGRKMPIFSDNLAISTVIEIGAYLDTVQK
jgi:mono/diheme cytochrome c family protein